MRVACRNQDDYRKVITDIRAHRAVVMKLSSLVMLCRAHSVDVGFSKGFLNLKPDMDSHKASLREVSDALRVSGPPSASNAKGCYELRPVFLRLIEEIASKGGPTFGSHVWDESCSIVNNLCNHKMPNSKQRMYMRYINSDSHAPSARNVGMPILYTFTRNGFVRYHDDKDESSVGVRYDMASDEFVDLVLHGPYEKGSEVAFIKMDHGARWVFRKIASGEWPSQSPVLNEKDGKLSLLIHYRRPPREMNLPKDNVMEVCFAPVMGERLKNTGRAGDTNDGKRMLIHLLKEGASSGAKRRVERLHANDAVAVLDRLSARSSRLQLQRSCRRHRRAKRKLAEKSDAIRARRKNVAREQNHEWSKSIVRIASAWNCGTIRLYGPPPQPNPKSKTNDEAHGMWGRSWPWDEFVRFVEYKAQERGIAIEVVPYKDAEDVTRRAMEEDDDGEGCVAS